MKIGSKIASMMDSYCQFIEYGTRGWVLYFCVVAVNMAMIYLVPTLTSLWAGLMFLSLFVMVFIWGHDFATGHVPVWFYEPRRWLAKRRKRD